MMTFEEFRDTRERLSPAEAAKRLQDDTVFSEESGHVLIYAGSLYILPDEDGLYASPIERTIYTGTLEKVERDLYLEWYCSECAEDYTSDQLSDLLHTWCDHNDIEYKSADEIQIDLMSKAPEDRSADERQKLRWIDWFLETWKATVAAEDDISPR